MEERDGPYYPDDQHSHGRPLEHHGWDARDGWHGYSSDKKLNEGLGLPPPPRVSREWAEHSSQLEEQQVPVWHNAVDTNMTGHEHIRWRGTREWQGVGKQQTYYAGRVHRAVSLLQVLSGALQDLGMGMWQQAGVAWLGKKWG